MTTATKLKWETRNHACRRAEHRTEKGDGLLVYHLDKRNIRGSWTVSRSEYRCNGYHPSREASLTYVRGRKISRQCTLKEAKERAQADFDLYPNLGGVLGWRIVAR